MGAPLMVSGLDVIAPSVAGLQRLQLPPPPQPLPDLRAAVASALRSPVAGPPLAERVRPRSRVLVVIEPPAHGVPLGEVRGLRLALAEILAELARAGLPRDRVRLLVANGLEPAPPMTELAAALGLEHTAAFACTAFDAEAPRGHRSFPDGQGGIQELSSALADCDLAIDLSLRAQGPRVPLHNLLVGLATYRTLQTIDAPDVAPSERERRLLQRGRALAESVELFSVALVQDGALISGALRLALGPASVRAWNRLPQVVRRRALTSWRSSAAPCAVFAGEPFATEERAEALARHHMVVEQGGQLDALIIPVPDLSPDSPRARSNPVLAAHLGLTHLLARARHRLHDGGAVILLNPLHEEHDRKLHLPFIDFYARALRLASTGPELAARFEVEASGRPEFVSAYQRRGAAHGALPFQRWYALEHARRGLRCFVVGAGAAAAQRVGLEPAEHLGSALDAAGGKLVGALDLLQL
jgi:hypothetical protein